MTDRSRRTRWVVGGLVLAALLLVGGPFVYFQVIQGDAPAPLALGSPSATAPAASASSGTETTVSNGTWAWRPGRSWATG